MTSELLTAGLISHGFKEQPTDPWEPRRFARLGREDRFVCEDGSILIEGIGTIPEGSDYHRLLEKCGSIMLRTREKYPPQKPLALTPALDADELLGELGGSNGRT